MSEDLTCFFSGSDSKMSEDSIVAGPKLEADQQTTEMDLRVSSVSGREETGLVLVHTLSQVWL